jgi:hypothetical protein
MKKTSGPLSKEGGGPKKIKGKSFFFFVSQQRGHLGFN